MLSWPVSLQDIPGARRGQPAGGASFSARRGWPPTRPLTDHMPFTRHSQSLKRLYDRYNSRAYVHPDPLEFLYRYDRADDREVAGLVAASLAYGRVRQILRSVEAVLAGMTGRPARFLRRTRPETLEAGLAGFVHRVWTGREVADLLIGIRGAIIKHGSLGACFAAGDDGGPTIGGALGGFVGELRACGGRRCGSLLPDPAKGSACKRLHLYLRWMVRRDQVDPGGWDAVRPSRLLVPLDTHMYRIGASLGAIRRRSADIAAAEQMTAAFRAVCPEDPVRYDFALTRLGIRPEDVSDRIETRPRRDGLRPNADLDSFMALCSKGS